MLPSLLTKIQSMLDFLSKEPYLGQLIPFLSSNICPYGEVTAIYVGRLGEDGSIECVHAYGFSTTENVTGSKVKLTEDRPLAEALRLNRTIVRRRKDSHQYKDYVPLDVSTPWESMAVIPVRMRTVFGFSFVKDLTTIEGIEDYVQCIKTLLEFFDLTNNNAQLSTRLRDSFGATDALTARQEKILSLIRENRTNAQIAHAVGFSESLVKQETIIIYRKLGVSGRKELIPTA